MATSGSTDYAQTSREVVQTALELCGAVQIGESASAEDAALALKHLNLLLKTWGTDPKLFIVAEGTVTPLVLATASYSVPLARRVVEARRRYSGIDTPLQPLSRQEYYDLPNKAQAGSANSFYFDPQRSTRTLYIWPVPTAAEVSGATIRYTYHRVIEDSDSLNNDPDVPQEWLETLAYCLAARIALPLGVLTSNPAQAAKLEERAGQLLAQLTADSQEETSVFFSPG
jgi:hypothetical protein